MRLIYQYIINSQNDTYFIKDIKMFNLNVGKYSYDNGYWYRNLNGQTVKKDINNRSKKYHL